MVWLLLVGKAGGGDEAAARVVEIVEMLFGETGEDASGVSD